MTKRGEDSKDSHTFNKIALNDISQVHIPKNNITDESSEFLIYNTFIRRT